MKARWGLLDLVAAQKPQRTERGTGIYASYQTARSKVDGYQQKSVWIVYATRPWGLGNKTI
jgi:hypothetical protein